MTGNQPDAPVRRRDKKWRKRGYKPIPVTAGGHDFHVHADGTVYYVSPRGGNLIKVTHEELRDKVIALAAGRAS